MLSTSRKCFAVVALSLLFIPCLAIVEVSCSDGFQEDCASFVKTFCQGIASELITPSDTATRCFAAKNGASCELAALNVGDGKAFPTVEDCETAFAAVSALCPQRLNMWECWSRVLERRLNLMPKRAQPGGVAWRETLKEVAGSDGGGWRWGGLARNDRVDLTATISRKFLARLEHTLHEAPEIDA
ncbi:hypothetical protein B0H19DRAFT_1071577 [Mycena capillaripes]|nr:hypothetical protein B0H19DRAFT_1071577 [Mycena capillaripes]